MVLLSLFIGLQGFVAHVLQLNVALTKLSFTDYRSEINRTELEFLPFRDYLFFVL